MMHFTIGLNPKTKKNSQRILRSGKGKPFISQSKESIQYEHDSGWFLKPTPATPINYPVNVKAHFYRRTKHRVDISNLHSALHDALVVHGILEDDNCNIIISTDGSRVYYDQFNPRTEIWLEKPTTSY